MPGPGFLDLPVRPGKPRRTGITHVLDRGLPLAQVTDLLEQNSSYVDVWKFGWGIAYLDPQLPAKLDLLARHRVLASPGGTLLEIAWAQGRAPEFLDWAADAGFPCVEVSAGTVPMPDAAKRDLIAAAAERFIVLAEVGSKQAAAEIRAEFRSKREAVEYLLIPSVGSGNLRVGFAYLILHLLQCALLLFCGLTAALHLFVHREDRKSYVQDAEY